MVGGVGEDCFGDPGFCGLYFFFAGHDNLMESNFSIKN
jgi:hypothetical protein